MVLFKFFQTTCHSTMMKVGAPFINKSVFSECKKLFAKSNINVVSKINNSLREIVSMGKDKLKRVDQTGVFYLDWPALPAAFYNMTSRAHKMGHLEHI